jgi:hypothetical protein
MNPITTRKRSAIHGPAPMVSPSERPSIPGTATMSTGVKCDAR